MIADYYAMLGIEPNADSESIEAAIARCRPLWSSGTRNPKNKHTYQSYLDQIPTIRQTLLGDPATRQAYDAGLQAANRADRDRKLDELLRLVKLRAAKGGLSVSDRELLKGRAEALGLTKVDLERLIEPIPVKAEAPREEDGPEPISDVLDATTRRQIRVALEHLGKRDLYDSLGLLRDAPTAEILARTTAERQRWMQKTQVTAAKTAWLEVISYAQSHLVGREERTRYDKTLVADAEERLMGSVVFAVEGLNRLDPGTHKLLVDEAGALGIAPDRAEKLIRKGCSTKGVARDVAPGILDDVSPHRLLRCRTCSGVTNHSILPKLGPGSQSCRHCRADLKWVCPVCKRESWVDEPRCSCGLSLESVEPLKRHFDEAQSAFKRRDLVDSLEHLEAAQALAPKHPGVKNGFEKIRERKAAIALVRTAWESARTARAYMAGLATVKQWEQLVASDDAEYVKAWTTASNAIREARAFVDQAKATNDTAMARGMYKKALEKVADLPEALDGLKRCPPDPPSGLVAEAHGDRVHLKWSAPPPDGLGLPLYRVVRKLGSVPANSTDGELVAETGAQFCEDTGIESGSFYGYAVFTRRDGIDSKRGSAAGPILVPGSVHGLRTEVRSHEVQLWWTTPSKAVGVKLVRKNGSIPSNSTDGDVLDCLRESAWDRELADDQVFGYAVYAQYRDSAGRVVDSPAATVVVRPHAPILGIAAPSIRIDGEGRLRLSWAAPELGVVLIVRLPRSEQLEFGSKLLPAVVESLPGPRFHPAGPEHTFDPDPPQSGTCLYYPLVGWAGEWVVGAPAFYSCLADPSDLRVVRVGGEGPVHLRWKWNPRAAYSRVVAKEGGFPDGPDDPAALALEIPEEEYSRLGYLAWSLPNPTHGLWRIAVYAVSYAEGERFVSSGADPSARTTLPGPNPEITVSYRIKRPLFPGRPWMVTISTDPPGEKVPPTVLVDHGRTVPLTSDDGRIVERFPSSRDGDSFPVPSGSNLSKGRARIFIDPLADPEILAPIRWKHPTGEVNRA